MICAVRTLLLLIIVTCASAFQAGVRHSRTKLPIDSASKNLWRQIPTSAQVPLKMQETLTATLTAPVPSTHMTFCQEHANRVRAQQVVHSPLHRPLMNPLTRGF